MLQRKVEECVSATYACTKLRKTNKKHLPFTLGRSPTFHTREKPYKCSYCPAEFSQKPSIHMHPHWRKSFLVIIVHVIIQYSEKSLKHHVLTFKYPRNVHWLFSVNDLCCAPSVVLFSPKNVMKSNIYVINLKFAYLYISNTVYKIHH